MFRKQIYSMEGISVCMIGVNGDNGMRHDIKISIVITIYNVKNYLKKCIESIINQSYKNIEIILVDDGSQDESVSICDYYAALDNRIRVIHKKNGGAVSARKAGIAIATGEYILNIDGDDWIDGNRIEDLVVRGIACTWADMIYMHGYIEEYEGNERCGQEKFCNAVTEKTYYGDEIERQILPMNCGSDSTLFVCQVLFAMWSWAIKRELCQKTIQLLDDRILIGEDDMAIWMPLLLAESVTMIRQNGYHYLQRGTSISHTAIIQGDKHVESTNALYHKLKCYIKEHSVCLKETLYVFLCYIMKHSLLRHYELIIEKTGYLYPFPKVKKGNKIVVYGAGMMGQELMGCLLNSTDYNVVLWVDKTVQESYLPECMPSPIHAIKRVEYDYIVIAVLSADVSQEIKENLVNMGIPEEKIANIDPDVISEDKLPDEILREI